MKQFKFTFLILNNKWIGKKHKKNVNFKLLSFQKIIFPFEIGNNIIIIIR